MDNECYGRSPAVESLAVIKSYLEIAEDIRVFASARFVEEKLIKELQDATKEQLFCFP